MTGESLRVAVATPLPEEISSNLRVLAQHVTTPRTSSHPAQKGFRDDGVHHSTPCSVR